MVLLYSEQTGIPLSLHDGSSVHLHVRKPSFTFLPLTAWWCLSSSLYWCSRRESVTWMMADIGKGVRMQKSTRVDEGWEKKMLNSSHDTNTKTKADVFQFRKEGAGETRRLNSLYDWLLYYCTRVVRRLIVGFIREPVFYIVKISASVDTGIGYQESESLDIRLCTSWMSERGCGSIDPPPPLPLLGGARGDNST